MKTIRQIRYTILLVLLCCCSDDFLEHDPKGLIIDKNLANNEGIELLLIGAYGMLDGNMGWSILYTSGTNWLFSDVYSDDAYVGSSDFDDFENMETYN